MTYVEVSWVKFFLKTFLFWGQTRYAFNVRQGQEKLNQGILTEREGSEHLTSTKLTHYFLCLQSGSTKEAVLQWGQLYWELPFSKYFMVESVKFLNG
jgi:hypothetical protein